MPNMFVSEEVRATCYKQRGTCDENGNLRTICHHIDFNHDNNDPENLIFVSKDEHTEIHKNNFIYYWRGKKQPKEMVEKRLKFLNGDSNPSKRQDVKDKISKANTGKKRSEEARIKMSVAHKGKTPWNKGVRVSSETREKLRKASSGKHRVYREDGSFFLVKNS